MARNPKPAETAAGPWDVLMEMVKRFPVFALILLFLGVSFYGVQLLLEQRDRAQKELAESRAKITELETKANDAFKLALEKEKDAARTLETAKAEAIAAVQDKQLDTAKKVQDLVTGQLKSMKELEDIRTATALEVNKELAKLKKARSDAEQRLAEAENKLRIAGLLSSIGRLANTLEDERGQAKNRIEDVVSSFTQDDETAVAAIERRIKSKDNPGLSAALEIVMARKTRDLTWVKRFSSRFDDKAQGLDAQWFDSVFGCCSGDYEAFLWEALLPLVSKLILDDHTDAYVRLNLASFYSYGPDSWRGPLFAELGYMGRDYVWDVIEFVIDVARGKYKKLNSYNVSRTPDLLFNFDAAAAHVWAEELLKGNFLIKEDRDRVRRFVADWSEQYPAMKQPPSEGIRTFWTSETVMRNADTYKAQGTSEGYSRVES